MMSQPRNRLPTVLGCAGKAWAIGRTSEGLPYFPMIMICLSSPRHGCRRCTPLRIGVTGLPGHWTLAQSVCHCSRCSHQRVSGDERCGSRDDCDAWRPPWDRGVGCFPSLFQWNGTRQEIGPLSLFLPLCPCLLQAYSALTYARPMLAGSLLCRRAFQVIS